ncbi:MAG: hypothetical protein WB439_02100, partial [Acidobacteriaceae bacterium]
VATARPMPATAHLAPAAEAEPAITVAGVADSMVAAAVVDSMAAAAATAVVAVTADIANQHVC